MLPNCINCMKYHKKKCTLHGITIEAPTDTTCLQFQQAEGKHKKYLISILSIVAVGCIGSALYILFL